MTYSNRMKLISKIAERACDLYPALDHLSTVMDIDCTLETTSIDLDRFMAADDFNFCHDITGIHNCLNRETRQLERGFLPRFTTTNHS